MSNLVVAWVNNTLHLDPPLDKDQVKSQLSSGYVIAEVLVLCGLMEEATLNNQFKEGSEEEDKLHNFELISSCLKKNHVKFDEQLIARIMTEQYGAAATLLCQIKDWVKAKEELENRPDSRVNKALISVRPHEYHREAVTKSGRLTDFLQHLVDTVGLTNYKEIDMAIHLKPFRDCRQRAEKRLDKLQAEEAHAHAVARANERSTSLTKSREQKEFFDQWMTQGRKEGKKNRRQHESIFRRLLQYELFLVESRRRRREGQQERAREEGSQGVAWFETNMLRLGLGDEGSNSGPGGAPGQQKALALGAKAEDPLSFLERIRQVAVDGDKVRRREVGDLMAELKGKAKARERARREREVRRRKEKLELLEAQRASDKAGEAVDRAVEVSSRAGVSQQGWAGEWDRRAAKAVKGREKEEALKVAMDQQKRAQEVAVKNFFDGMADKAQQVEAARAASRADYEIFLMEKQQAKHEEVEMLCVELVVALADFAVHCSEEKTAGGGPSKPLTLSQWKALKDRFVGGELFGAPIGEMEEGDGVVGEIGVEESKPPQTYDRRSSIASLASSNVSSLLATTMRRKAPHADVLSSAEAFVWWHDWTHGEGGLWRPPTTLFSQDRLASEEAPEVKIIKTINELLQDQKPRIALERPSKVGLASPLRVNLLGSRPDLLDMAKPLAMGNNLLLITTELAIEKATALSKNEGTEEDKEGLLASSPTLQALQQLGTQYLAITTDPKKPAAPSDLLILDILLAYAKAYLTDKAGWLMVGYPSTVLQAKLLERGLTGATDPEVEDYLLSLAGKGAKKKRASDAGLKKGAAAAAGGCDPPPPRVSGLDLLVRIRTPTEETTDGLGSFYLACAPGVLGHLAVTLGASHEDPTPSLEETLDILLDHALDAKAKIETAPSNESPSQMATELMEEVESRRRRRIEELSKAGQMWRAYVVEGRFLDLERLRKEMDRWENQTVALGRETHRALTRLVKQAAHGREQRDLMRRRLAHLLRGDLPGFKDLCSLACLSHGRQAPEDLVNELEVGLGDVVEERYDQCCELKDEAVSAITKEFQRLLADATTSLTALIRVEYKKGKASLALLTAFDGLNNITTQRVTTVPKRSFFPLTTTFRERLLEELTSAKTTFPTTFTTEVRSALSSIEAGLHQAFTRPISTEIISDLDAASAASIHRLRQVVAAWTHVQELGKQLVEGLAEHFRAETVKRMTQQLDVVTEWVDRIRRLYQVGNGMGVAQLLRHGSEEGLEVDESRRAPIALGPLVADPGVCYLSPKQISTLTYCLRARASRYYLMKRDLFVKCVMECVNKNGFPFTWTSMARIRAVALRLDPFKSGQVAWRRFVHALICGLLPRLPTLEELLATRMAVDSKQKVDYSTTPTSSFNYEKRQSFYQAMSPLRITVNEFLDLPLWFETDELGPRTREIKELYALAWTEEDSKISLHSFLLQLCESLLADPDDGLLPCLPSAIVKAAVLLCQPLEKDQDPEVALRAFEIKIGSTSARPDPSVPYKAIHQLLVTTSLHNTDRAMAWMDAQGFERGKDILLSSLLAAPGWSSSQGAPLVMCDVYHTLNSTQDAAHDGDPESRSSSGHNGSRPSSMPLSA